MAQIQSESELHEALRALTDEKYREFQSGLIPDVTKEQMLGVRTPVLRKLAKELAASPWSAEFINTLPHRYYEENNLHGFLIERIKNYDDAVVALERFLPYVDNWATCDLMTPPVLGKHLPELYRQIGLWIASDKTYTVRFALEMLMHFYLDDAFHEDVLALAATARSDEYYVKMMVAWFFATALAKQYDATLPYIEKQVLDTWTHNKAIQKAIESYRITPEQKTYLRTLKITKAKD